MKKRPKRIIFAERDAAKKAARTKNARVSLKVIGV